MIITTAREIIMKALNIAPVRNMLRPVYHAIEDIIQGNILEKNKCLKNKFEGQRCFIVCSGASLNDIEVSNLEKEYIFGAGHLHSPELDHRVISRKRLMTGYNPKNISPTFYVAGDPVREILSGRNMVKYHVDFWESANIAFSNPDTIFFLNGSDKRFFEKHKLLTGRKVHYVKTLMPMDIASTQSNDLTRRITFFDGTIFIMLAASIYMGFKELYLCGCGYTYQPIQFFHFYNETDFPLEMPENERNRLIDELLKAHGLSILKVRQDGHYYRPVYIRNKPVDWRHEIMNEFAKHHGVNIYNIVPDGFDSPIYEKVSWDFVVKNVLEKTNDSPSQNKLHNEISNDIFS